MRRSLFFLFILVIFSLFSCKKDELAEKYDSNNYFIKILNPTTNLEWEPNNAYTINWESNTGAKIKIELYRAENIVHTLSPVEENNGNYNWTVPYYLFPDTTYRIKITSLLRTGISGFSQYFTINGDSIMKFIQPSPFVCNNWIKGTDSLITWSDNLDEDVKIDLYLNDIFLETITNSTPGNGSYLWPVPSHLSTNSNYRIKISSVANSTIFGFSDLFRISLLSEINLVKNGNFNSEDHWIISNPTINSKYRWNIIDINKTAEITTLNSSGSISQELSLIAGQSYIVTYTLSKNNGYFGGANDNGAAIVAKIGTTLSSEKHYEGTYTDTLIAGGTAIEFQIIEDNASAPNKGFVCTMDNIEVVAQ